jgi:Co/Zn/Cd efflux system component
MNIVLAAAIVAIAILIAGHEIRKYQGPLQALTQHSHILSTAGTIANIAAILMAARLGDGEYMERLRLLRVDVEIGSEIYSGPEGEERYERARQMLKEIDYREASVQKQWIAVAEGLYWQTFWKTRDDWPRKVDSEG